MINIDDFISSICRFGEVDGQVQSALSCRASMSTFVHMLYYTYMHILCIYIYISTNYSLISLLIPSTTNQNMRHSSHQDPHDGDGNAAGAVMHRTVKYRWVCPY